MGDAQRGESFESFSSDSCSLSISKSRIRRTFKYRCVFKSQISNHKFCSWVSFEAVLDGMPLAGLQVKKQVKKKWGKVVAPPESRPLKHSSRGSSRGALHGVASLKTCRGRALNVGLKHSMRFRRKIAEILRTKS